MRAAMVMMGVVVGCASGDVYTGGVVSGVGVPDDVSAGVEVVVGVDAPVGVVVDSVVVDLVIEHDWVGDLVVVLRAPSGVEVVLLDRAGIPNAGGFPGPFGCGGRDIDARFVDGAMDAAETMCSTTAVPVISGDVRGVELLSGFVGAGVGGDWVLVVSDRLGYDTGSVVSVGLTIEGSSVCAADLNGDGSADFFDVSELLQNSVDYNGDTGFDFFDISAFLQDLSAGCP